MLAGGQDFINRHVDVVLLELMIREKHPSAKSYQDMLYMMGGLGFEMVDEVEARRCPATGRLQQKNVVFCKRETSEMRKAA